MGRSITKIFTFLNGKKTTFAFMSKGLVVIPTYNEVENIERQKEVVYNVLKFQMGYPIREPILAVDDIDALFEPATEAELTESVDYAKRPEVQVLELGIRLNELNVEFNKSGYLPSLSAFLNYQQSAQGNSLFKNPIWVPSSVSAYPLRPSHLPASCRIFSRAFLSFLTVSDLSSSAKMP